jgi:hypothetical protein
MSGVLVFFTTKKNLLEQVGHIHETGKVCPPLQEDGK